MAAIHQHRKALLTMFHLPDEDRVSVAYIDKIQYQHTCPPIGLLVLRYHSCQIAATKNRVFLRQKFLLNFDILTKHPALSLVNIRTVHYNTFKTMQEVPHEQSCNHESHPLH